MGINTPFPPKDFVCRVCQKSRDEVINKGLIIKVCNKLCDEHQNVTCTSCNKMIMTQSFWKTGTNLKCNRCEKESFTRLTNQHCDKCFNDKICSHFVVNFEKNNCPRCNQEWNWKDHTSCFDCDEKEHPINESRNKSEINPPRDYLRRISIWGGVGSIALIVLVLIVSLLKKIRNKFDD